MINGDRHRLRRWIKAQRINDSACYDDDSSGAETSQGSHIRRINPRDAH
jgi:deferrochelatase/peroxidase EfeB